MKPNVAAARRRGMLARELDRVRRKYSVYHYKNTCGMVGTVVGVNYEFLTSRRSDVNCPYCIQRLKRAANLRQ